MIELLYYALVGGIIMASMQSIPDIVFDSAILRDWGVKWRSTVGSPKKDGTPTTKNPDCFDKKQGMDFGMAMKIYSGVIGLSALIVPMLMVL